MLHDFGPIATLFYAAALILALFVELFFRFVALHVSQRRLMQHPES
jgi:hypothetical protein